MVIALCVASIRDACPLWPQGVMRPKADICMPTQGLPLGLL